MGGQSMMTESTIYWITRLTSLKEGLEVGGVILLILSGVVILLGIMAWCLEQSETGKKSLKISILVFILGGLIAFSSIFVPTTKEMCAIKAIPVIINNEQVQELPNKVVELANDWIDTQRTGFTDELKSNKDDE